MASSTSEPKRPFNTRLRAEANRCWRSMLCILGLSAVVALVSVIATVVAVKGLASNPALLDAAKLFLVPLAIVFSAFVAIRAYRASSKQHITLLTNDIVREWLSERMEACRVVVWSKKRKELPQGLSCFESIPVTAVAKISDEKLRDAMRHICHFLNRVAFLYTEDLVRRKHLHMYFSAPFVEYGSLFSPIIHAERMTRPTKSQPDGRDEKYLGFFEEVFKSIYRNRDKGEMSFKKLHDSYEPAPHPNSED